MGLFRRQKTGRHTGRPLHTIPKGAVRHDIPLLHLPKHRCHPANHGQGCDLCIQKELRKGEIPSCFFNLVIRPGETVEDCTMAAFARRVLEREAETAADGE